MIHPETLSHIAAKRNTMISLPPSEWITEWKTIKKMLGREPDWIKSLCTRLLHINGTHHMIVAIGVTFYRGHLGAIRIEHIDVPRGTLVDVLLALHDISSPQRVVTTNDPTILRIHWGG